MIQALKETYWILFWPTMIFLWRMFWYDQMPLIPIITLSLSSCMLRRVGQIIFNGNFTVIQKANFKDLQETLESSPWDLVTSDDCINTSLAKFQDTLFLAIDQHIPQVALKRQSRPPWITNNMKLIRKRRDWKHLRTKGSDFLFSKLRDLRERTKKLINSSCHQYLKSLLGKLQDNPKYFWSFY